MAIPYKVLLVDDETQLTDAVGSFLERDGFTVAAAASAIEALNLLPTFEPDLIVLDILMPGMNGRELLRHLRQQQNWTPIVMLTRVGEAAERARAIEEGADDYINKPFDPTELAARIRAVLRRARPGKPSLAMARRLVCGALCLDRVARRVLLNDRPVELTHKAVQLLEYLMTHPDEGLGRERILDAVWNWGDAFGTRAVDARIAELRKALHDDHAEPVYIETLPTHGYRFIGKVEVLP